MPHSANPYADLQRPIVQVSKEDYLTLEDLYAGGVCIIGSTGSGKSSCAAHLARSLLSADFGGVFFTAKPGDRQEIERYAADVGKSHQVVILSPDSGQQFNFLRYEMTRPGAGARDSANITDLFYSVLEAGNKHTGGGGDSAHWDNWVRQLILNACDLCFFARDTIGLQEMKDIIASAPQNRAEARNAEWQKESFCYRLIEEAEKKPRAEDEQHDFEECISYFLEELPALSDKTRSIIVSMFTSMASYFLRGKLRRMFCDGLTIRPEDTWEKGKIIIVDLPVKEYNQRGRFAQILFKYIFQRAAERRNTAQHPRGVVIWADEAQQIVTAYDAQFASTSRSSRVCTVYLSQSLPVYYSAFGAGSERAKYDALALLGNMQVKFLHSQTEQETCEWMSSLVGKAWSTRINTSTNTTPVDTVAALIGQANPQGNSVGTSEVLEHLILPAEWKLLRTGGWRNNGYVDVVLLQGGRIWSNRETFLRVMFRQEGF